MFRCFRCFDVLRKLFLDEYRVKLDVWMFSRENSKKKGSRAFHADTRPMSSPDEIAEALEATHLNVEVDDPKLYHGNCVDVIANKVADGSVDLVLNDPPRSWMGLSTRYRFFSTHSTTGDPME